MVYGLHNRTLNLNQNDWKKKRKLYGHWPHATCADSLDEPTAWTLHKISTLIDQHTQTLRTLIQITTKFKLCNCKKIYT